MSLRYNTNLARQHDLQGHLLSEITPFTYIAKGGNPNILNHRDAMKADDNEQFLTSMKQEVDKLLENEIYEIVPCNTVPKTKTVLNAVWSHRRKTTPNGTVYRHRSRICANGSQQNYVHDFMDTYSPVVSWKTVRLLLVL